MFLNSHDKNLAMRQLNNNQFGAKLPGSNQLLERDEPRIRAKKKGPAIKVVWKWTVGAANSDVTERRATHGYLTEVVVGFDGIFAIGRVEDGRVAHSREVA